jgi:adenosylcobinamide kinase / adenosylcobinamide-phosphate guanylyltransferase
VSIAHRSDLILGGVRSGKSREAMRLAATLPPATRGAFLATAQPLDADMRARIARHQADRPKGWATVEEPFDLVRACEGLANRCDVVVLDCLTLWVANLILRGEKESAVLDAADGLARFVGLRRVSCIIVSNEVGAGVHPPTEVGLVFRDVLGEVNQRIAACADRVTYMVAGIPMTIKNVSASGDLRGRAVEGP